MLSKPEINDERITYQGIPLITKKKDKEIIKFASGSGENNKVEKNSKKISSGKMTYFEQIFDSRTEAILILNNNNEVVNANRGFEAMFQYSFNEVEGRIASDFIVPDELKNESNELLGKLDNGIEINKETIRKRKDGHFINVYITGNKLDLEDNTTGKYLIYFDISKHKKSEEQIKASLLEKEVLLKEIHHRVKNNLQVVSSLLYLQSRMIKDENMQYIFLNCQNRVKSISLIHEKLYQTNNLARIDFDKYLKALVYHLFNSFGVKSSQISLSIVSENVFLTMDTAIPCGLIINELVTNALKHAFPSERKGEISIEVQYLRNNKFVLIVKDNGIGLPKGLDYENTETLGFQLVDNLVKQLDATFEINSDKGTEYKITFSILDRKGGGE